MYNGSPRKPPTSVAYARVPKRDHLLGYYPALGCQRLLFRLKYQFARLCTFSPGTQLACLLYVPPIPAPVPVNGLYPLFAICCLLTNCLILSNSFRIYSTYRASSLFALRTLSVYIKGHLKLFRLARTRDHASSFLHQLLHALHLCHRSYKANRGPCRMSIQPSSESSIWTCRHMLSA